MHFLDLTLPQIESNLALDEALLQAAEAGQGGEVLRIWEVSQFAVVVGRASRVAEEVHQETCQKLGVPIVRRCSGGCAVVIGPGCLLYSLVFNLQDRPHWRKVDRLHRDVRETLISGLNQCGLNVTATGTSDLALVLNPSEDSRPRKISGNSVRFARNHVLYHGTLLYAFDLQRMTLLLKQPSRQPAYRMGRPHEAFVTNIPMERNDLVTMFRRIWAAHNTLADWPQQQTQILLEKRYSLPTWHFER